MVHKERLEVTEDQMVVYIPKSETETSMLDNIFMAHEVVDIHKHT